MSTTASRAFGVGVSAVKIMQPIHTKGANAPKGGPGSVSSKTGLPAPSLTGAGDRASVSNVAAGKRGSLYAKFRCRCFSCNLTLPQKHFLYHLSINH